jgi:hypothetical protein
VQEKGDGSERSWLLREGAFMIQKGATQGAELLGVSDTSVVLRRERKVASDPHAATHEARSDRPSSS